jgi:hypothetical protein
MAAFPALKSELEAAVLFKLGAGFDLGLGVHGGVASRDTTGVLGADIVVRFFCDRDFLFWGLQAQVGIADTAVFDPHTEPEFGYGIPVTVGAAFGGTLESGARIYVSPAVELGQTMQGGDVVWKSGVGLRATFGAAVPVADAIYLVIETRPSISKFDSSPLAHNFRLDSGLSALFGF